MNVKLLAASILLAQSGVFLVSDSYNLAYALQTVVYGWRYAGQYLQLSN
jgi:hypothetical protein